MRWKTARRGATVAAAAAATVGLTAGTALADTTALLFDGDDHVVSRATYITNGDNLKVCDGWADGHSAVALLEVQGVSGHRTSWATQGIGSCHTTYLNFVEGRYYELRACIGDWGTKQIIKCGPAVTGRT